MEPSFIRFSKEPVTQKPGEQGSRQTCSIHHHYAISRGILKATLHLTHPSVTSCLLTVTLLTSQRPFFCNLYQFSPQLLRLLFPADLMEPYFVSQMSFSAPVTNQALTFTPTWMFPPSLWPPVFLHLLPACCRTNLSPDGPLPCCSRFYSLITVRVCTC